MINRLSQRTLILLQQSRVAKQSQIDSLMKDLLHKYSTLLNFDERIGEAVDMEPVHIETDKTIKPIMRVKLKMGIVDEMC